MKELKKEMSNEKGAKVGKSVGKGVQRKKKKGLRLYKVGIWSEWDRFREGLSDLRIYVQD